MSTPAADRPATVLLITREGIGQADAPLALKLLRIYSTLLMDDGAPPEAICFYTEGVKLVAEGSVLLDILSDLQKRGGSPDRLPDLPELFRANGPGARRGRRQHG